MSRALKILFLTHRFYPYTGGIEVNSRILATEFQKSGHEVHLMTWTRESGTLSFDFKITRDPSISQLFKAHRWADVVFENNPSYRLSWPKHFFRSVNVIAIRTLINRADGKRALQDKLKIKQLGWADAVIAVSTAIRDACWPGATVIPNPFRNELFKKIDTKERERDFVFLGRLVSQKRCDLSIELIAKLKESHPQKANLTVIGNGPEMDSLKRLVADLNLEENVRFVGELKGQSLLEALNEHKYMLIPSEFEAFGNVALEGLACGNLPIVSDSGGLTDAVGDAGLSFKSSDLKSFYKVTVSLLENPEEEIRIRALASDHLSNHNPEKIARRYLEIIESAYRRAKPRKHG